MKLVSDIGQIRSVFSSLRSSVNCLNTIDKIFAPMDERRETFHSQYIHIIKSSLSFNLPFPARSSFPPISGPANTPTTAEVENLIYCRMSSAEVKRSMMKYIMTKTVLMFRLAGWEREKKDLFHLVK